MKKELVEQILKTFNSWLNNYGSEDSKFLIHWDGTVFSSEKEYQGKIAYFGRLTDAFSYMISEYKKGISILDGEGKEKAEKALEYIIDNAKGCVILDTLPRKDRVESIILMAEAILDRSYEPNWADVEWAIRLSDEFTTDNTVMIKGKKHHIAWYLDEEWEFAYSYTEGRYLLDWEIKAIEN